MAKRVRGQPLGIILNGQPAAVLVDGRAVVGAIVLDIMDGRIVGVRVVTNPDKLVRLREQVLLALPAMSPAVGVEQPAADLSRCRSR